MPPEDAGQTNPDTGAAAAGEGGGQTTDGTILGGEASTEGQGGDAGANGEGAAATGEGEGGGPASEEGGGQEGAAGEGEGEGTDGEGKTGEGEGEVPEAYDFSSLELPEGVEIDDNLVETVSPIMKELELNQEQADKLAQAFAEHQQKQASDQAAAFEKQLNDWADQLKTDKEVGGDEFNANMAIARKAVETYGDDDLKSFMESTGAGSNPALVKFMHRVGQTLKEDGSAPGGAPNQQGQSREQRMYPDD